MSPDLTRNVTLLAALLAGTAAVAQEDRTVRIVLDEELDVVEPCMAARSDVGRVIYQNINETLTEFVPGETELEPRLATEWSQVDDDTWRLKLREGVTFHDGTGLDAADVAFTLDRIKVTKFGCEVGVKYFGDLEFASGIVDDTTIDITTTPGTPILPLLLSTVPIMPSRPGRRCRSSSSTTSLPTSPASPSSPPV